MTDFDAEDLLRRVAPQVLGVLVRRHGQFDACEDAVAEALVAATTQWPEEGTPADPVAWLITVAGRRLTDLYRSEHARRRREETVHARAPSDELLAPAPGEDSPQHSDDTLKLLFLCCHPELSPPSQIALTLRAVGGLTTAQIATAFLVPEATMAQRISRAKQRIKATGATFAMPAAAERAERLRAVLHVLYLIFNEGYTATSGPELLQTDLTVEAIRLTRAVHGLLPGDSEVTGLLALMLLTDARSAARTGPEGQLIPLAEQDRGRWDAEAIREGVALVSEGVKGPRLGEYLLQAAIAAVHGEAPSDEDTDWAEIRWLYQVLDRVAGNPMVTLNRAVAIAKADGPEAGLALLSTLDKDRRIAGHYRIDAVRAHLLELAGDHAGARENYLLAAKRTVSLPEQRYLEERAARLS